MCSVVKSIRFNCENASQAIEGIFPQKELAALLNAFSFRSNKSSAPFEEYKIYISDNPFDKNGLFDLKFNNGVRIAFDQDKECFHVKIGMDTGWVAGIEMKMVEYNFSISKLDITGFSQGLNDIHGNQKYALVSCYGTGNADKYFLYGSMQEIEHYVTEKNYKQISTQSVIPVSYVNSNRSNYDNARILYLLSLSEKRVNNIFKKKYDL